MLAAGGSLQLGLLPGASGGWWSVGLGAVARRCGRSYATVAGSTSVTVPPKKCSRLGHGCLESEVEDTRDG